MKKLPSLTEMEHITSKEFGEYGRHSGSDYG